MAEGAIVALNSTAETFVEELREVCAAHDCRLAFDAVAGAVGAQVFHALQPGITKLVYKECNVFYTRLKGWLTRRKSAFQFSIIRDAVMMLVNKQIHIEENYPALTGGLSGRPDGQLGFPGNPAAIEVGVTSTNSRPRAGPCSLYFTELRTYRSCVLGRRPY